MSKLGRALIAAGRWVCLSWEMQWLFRRRGRMKRAREIKAIPKELLIKLDAASTIFQCCSKINCMKNGPRRGRCHHREANLRFFEHERPYILFRCLENAWNARLPSPVKMHRAMKISPIGKRQWCSMPNDVRWKSTSSFYFWRKHFHCWFMVVEMLPKFQFAINIAWPSRPERNALCAQRGNGHCIIQGFTSSERSWRNVAILQMMNNFDAISSKDLAMDASLWNRFKILSNGPACCCCHLSQFKSN